MNTPIRSDTPDILIRDNILHDGTTTLLGADFQSPDILVRREPIPAVLLDETLASHHGWARDASQAVSDAAETRYCYLRARYSGSRARAVTFRLFESAQMACAPPRASWSLLGEQNVTLTPNQVSYAPEAIEWAAPDCATNSEEQMLIFELASPDHSALTEKGGDLATFHKDLASHGRLRFKNNAVSLLNRREEALYRLRVSNFADREKNIRIRLIGGLPIETVVEMSIGELDASVQGTIHRRPEKMWMDATLPAGFSGFCDVSVSLPADHTGPAGYQLRTAYHHDHHERVIDGGALNVQLQREA